MIEYADYIASKASRPVATGLESPCEPSAPLFDFQRDIVKWALRRGRAATFADCGLGKTAMQLSWAEQVPGNVLILAPLAVAPQTVREGKKFGIPVTHTNETFPVQVWQRYASPVWMDINPSDTLQKESAREDKDERHICPLQLQVIQRGLNLWSNPGDLVLSPFAGIGSEGFVSLKMGRKFVGAELKESYWKQAAANLRSAENAEHGSLFNGL